MTEKKQRILVDMDEVIADPMGDMIRWYRNEYGRDVDYEKMLVGSWVKGFPEEHQALVRERLMSPGFFRNLSVMPHSVEVLEQMNRNYEVFIVSAATEFPFSLKEKLDWLGEHFPYFSWRQLVLCGNKSVVHGDYMIDDHVWNLEPFQGEKLLFTAAHNLSVTGFRRVNNWQEVAAIFLP